MISENFFNGIIEHVFVINSPKCFMLNFKYKKIKLEDTLYNRFTFLNEESIDIINYNFKENLKLFKEIKIIKKDDSFNQKINNQNFYLNKKTKINKKIFYEYFNFKDKLLNQKIEKFTFDNIFRNKDDTTTANETSISLNLNTFLTKSNSEFDSFEK